MTISLIRAGRIATLAALTLALTTAPLSAAQRAGIAIEPQTYLITSTIVAAAGPLIASELLRVSATDEISAPAPRLRSG